MKNYSTTMVYYLLPLLFVLTKVTLGAEVNHSALINNALDGWKRIEDSATKQTYVFETFRDDGIEHDPTKNDYSKWRVKASFLGNNILFHKFFDRGDGTAIDFVACKNEHYVFRVLRSDENSPWQMDDLELPGSGNQVHSFDTDDLESVLSPWAILQIPLRVIINDPTFKLISESEHDEENSEFVSFSFELNSTNSTYNLLTQLQQCKVVLDPKHDYAVIKFEAQFANKDGKSHFKGIGKCVYKFDTTGFPALQSYHYSLLRGSGTQKIITWTTTFSKIEPCVLAPKDFMLSSYGLSEPEDPNRRLNIVRIALMTAGVLLILFGLYMRWFATKK